MYLVVQLMLFWYLLSFLVLNVNHLTIHPEIADSNLYADGVHVCT